MDHEVPFSRPVNGHDHAIPEALRHVDIAHEHRFVSGYMGLMNCSEAAARAVYMHLDFATPAENAW